MPLNGQSSFKTATKKPGAGTRRERVEDKLRISEEQYRVLFQINPQPMWVYDLETLQFLAVNDAAIELHGVPREELLALTIKDLRSPEEVPRLAEYLPRAGEGLNLWGEWRHRKKDGTEINVEITFLNITWLGRPSRLVLVKDITDHKRALKALEDAEQKFRSIFENAVVGMFQTTEEGRLLTANLALARIYGFESPGDLMRSVNNINKLYVDPPGRAEFLRRLSERGAAWGFEAQHYRKDGSVIWVLESARAVRDSTGKVLYFEGSVQSITDRKRAEETLRELSGRVLQLQDEERRHLARELHDSTAQDLSIMARNLRRLSESRSLDPAVDKILSETLEMAEKCTQGVRTLSYLLHPPLLDEVGLVCALGWYVRGFTQRSGIRVEVVTPTEYRRLTGELERTLFRIVQESLTNVHRHSGSRTAWIELVLDTDRVKLEVRDEGRGIPSETLKKFHAGGVGLGVGVAGMRERVRQLGGRLDLESNGSGTVVRATLPLQGARA